MKLLAVIVIFIIGFLVLVFEESPHPLPSPGKESQPVQNSGAHENQKTRPPDASGKDFSFPINRQYSAVVGKPDVHDSSDDPSPPPSDERIVWLTGVLAAAAVIQLFIYGRQAHYMNEGLKVTRQSVKAAQDSADAVKAAFRRERPYVLVTGVKLYNFGRCFDYKEWQEKPYMVEARCAMKNFGKTPAIIKTVVARLGPSTSPLPEPPDFSQCVKVYDATVGIISAGEESYARVDLDESEGHLASEGWDKLKDPNSSARIDLRGVITYEDPIGEEFTTSFGYLCVWGRSGESADPHWVVLPAQSSYFKRT